MHPALVARDDGPAMQRNVPHTHVGRSERAMQVAPTHMVQTPRRASTEAAGAMQYDAIAAIVREIRGSDSQKKPRARDTLAAREQRAKKAHA